MQRRCDEGHAHRSASGAKKFRCRFKHGTHQSRCSLDDVDTLNPSGACHLHALLLRIIHMRAVVYAAPSVLSDMAMAHMHACVASRQHQGTSLAAGSDEWSKQPLT